MKIAFRALIAGGGAPETEIAIKLANYAQTITGVDAYCFKAFADALEVIPSTLAENAGLNPIATVTELRNRHSKVSRIAYILIIEIIKSCPLLYINIIRSIKIFLAFNYKKLFASSWKGRIQGCGAPALPSKSSLCLSLLLHAYLFSFGIL